MLSPVGCNPARGCVESSFQLRANSRLPRWFGDEVSRAGRSEYSVEMSYFVPLMDIDNAVIELRRPDGRRVRTITGKSCWHPATRWTKLPDGSFQAAPDPHFVIVTAGGVTDVVEHRSGPGFGMSDDPEILRQALESVARGECRGQPDNDSMPPPS